MALENIIHSDRWIPEFHTRPACHAFAGAGAQSEVVTVDG